MNLPQLVMKKNFWSSKDTNKMIRSHYSNFDTYMIHLQKHPGCLSHVRSSAVKAILAQNLRGCWMQMERRGTWGFSTLGRTLLWRTETGVSGKSWLSFSSGPASSRLRCCILEGVGRDLALSTFLVSFSTLALSSALFFTTLFPPAFTKAQVHIFSV